VYFCSIDDADTEHAIHNGKHIHNEVAEPQTGLISTTPGASSRATRPNAMGLTDFILSREQVLPKQKKRHQLETGSFKLVSIFNILSALPKKAPKFLFQ